MYVNVAILTLMGHSFPSSYTIQPNTVRSESRCALLEVMSTSVYTGLNLFNFIRKHSLHICIRKVAVHLLKVLEVMSTSVYTGLNPFNFIRKHFLQICVRKVAVHL
jgi:hypothetical protein